VIDRSVILVREALRNRRFPGFCGTHLTNAVKPSMAVEPSIDLRQFAAVWRVLDTATIEGNLRSFELARSAEEH
jgi:hypothetical protein